MKYRLNIIILFLVQWNLLNASQELEKRNKLSIQHYFSLQSFDSCLFFQYLLTNIHYKEQDSINLVKDWYYIAWLNILQEEYVRAKAAKILAERYAAKRTDLFENIYMGLLWYKQGEYKKALPCLRGIDKNPNTEFHYIINVARIFLVNAEAELKGAEIGLSGTKKILEHFRSDKDTAWFGYPMVQKNFGIYLYKNGRFRECLRPFEDAIKIFEKLHIYNENWLECYKFLIDASCFASRTDLCDSYSWKLNNSFSKINSELLPFYYYLKGNLFYIKNQFKDAINVYLKVFSGIKILPKDDYYAFTNFLMAYFYLKQYDKVIEWCEKFKTKLNEREYLKILLAYCYHKTGKQQKAFNLLDQAKKSFKYDLYKFHFIGNYYFQIRQDREIEFYLKKYLQKSLKTYGRVGYIASFANNIMGYFYWYGKSDYKKALYYFHQEVMSLVTSKFSNDYYILPDITKSINDEALSKALNNKGEAFYEVSKQQKNKTEALRNLLASLANLELSIEIAHRVKMAMFSDEKKYNYAGKIQHRYYYLINVCLDLYQKTGNQVYINKAFEYTEKSKATTLLAVIRGAAACKIHLIPDSLKSVEDKLWKLTELTSFNLFSQYDSPKPDINVIDKLNNDLYNLKVLRDSLIQLYKLKYPVYYRTKFDDDVMSVEKLQKILKPDEVILQYSLSTDRIVIFSLSSKGLNVFSDSITSHFYSNLQYYREFVAGFSVYNCLDTAVKNFEKRSNALYNILIKPVERYITGKHLIIIPDGFLAQIPFEALVSKINNCSDFQCMSYLVKENAISYEYSGTLYGLNGGNNRITNTKLLAMAPRFDNQKIKNIPGKEWESLKDDGNALISIPGTFEEVESIYKSFNGLAIIKNQATEEKFKKIAGNYDILHLAMHGVVNNEIPMLSKLVFTPVNDSVNEGLLNTYEIYDLKINAQLVVLSACNTGAGRLYKGEGVMSIARAFYTSGAKSVVMTLWPVADKTSSNLISIFYKRLASQQNIGNALRQAKIEYLESVDGISAHPGFWAGYIVTGNSEIVFEGREVKSKIIVWLTLSGMIFLILLWFRKKYLSK